jgi:hypothetical protein
MRAGVFSPIFAVIAVGFLISTAEARPAHDRHSLDQILPQIRQQHPGTLYDADGPFVGADGRAHYRIKWVTPEGRVQWLDADARSGRVTNAEGRNESFDDGRGGPDNRGDYDDRGNGNNDDDRRTRFNNDRPFENPFDRGDYDGNDGGRHRDNRDWNNNGGNWDRGNRGGRRNSGGQNNGGGHRHHGH